MMTNKIMLRDVTVSSAYEACGGSHIGGDILLVDDITRVRLRDGLCRMQCLFLALCTRGTACYIVDTVERTVVPGDLIIVSEGQVTDSCQFSDDCDGLCMIVSYDFFNEAIKNVHELSSLFLFARSHPVCHLTADESESIKRYYSTMRGMIGNEHHHFRSEMVRSVFTTMVYDVSNTIYRIQNEGGQYSTRAEKIFTDFVRLVERNFRTERRVGWYAQTMCISPKYLSETVRAISRRTPTEWVDNYVTLELRVLLKNSTKSIKEIAQEMNFSNQSFLGKYFKDHVGMSPREYRKSGI